MLGGTGYQVGLAVVAFDYGGAGAVGIAFTVQILPLALAAPFTSVLADRWPRRRLMLAIDILRCACTGAVAAAVASGGSLPLVLLLGAPGAIASTAYQPATRALLPSLATEPDELTAANVVAGGIENAAVLVGPALAGVLVAAGGAAVSFAAGSVLFLISALMVARLRGGRERPTRDVQESLKVAVTAGMRTIATTPMLRVLTGVYAAQMLVTGAVNVLAVVIARDLIRLGDPGVGAMFAALGAGGLLGTVAAAAGLTGGRRLSGALGLGVLLGGVALALVGLSPSTATATAGLAVVGLATVFVDIAAVTLIQRSVADEILGRVFGVLQTVLVAMIGLGSALAPGLIAWLGIRSTLLVLGASLPVFVALTWGRLRAADAPSKENVARVALLRGSYIFAPLPAPALEALAAGLIPVDVPGGVAVIHQGDVGDRFYLIAEGTVEVHVDGSLVTTHGVGEGFGEIALIRGTSRTATVLARGAVRLYALERDVFLDAVISHPASRTAAKLIAGARFAYPAISRGIRGR